MKTDSQKNRIRQILDDGRFHCSDEIIQRLGGHIVDYRARISSIRKDLRLVGKTVNSEPCKGRCGRNHEAPVFVYWISDVSRTASQLFPDRCCYSLKVFGTHDRSCPELKPKEKEINTLF